MKHIILLTAAFTILSACTGSPGPGETAKSAPSKGAARSGRDDRLDTRDFDGLPPEARTYLEDLSRAFRSQDAEFLLGQGERQFEAEVKPLYDDESYLALLYRAGSWGTDTPPAETEFPRLFPGEIRRIEYSSWEERGPALEIRGRLVTRTGAIPCAIMLIWRLREPKIQGIYP
ncbi:MAG: hypothetical protein LBP23_08855 [Treponema sp.]|jgi:hypothetical protein|nr:hypothetical protein [Treponema sp.]